MSAGPRRFMCSEADYLTAYNVPLDVASHYAQRFTPRQVVELHEAGVDPATANAQDPRLNSLQVIALLDGEDYDDA